MRRPRSLVALIIALAGPAPAWAHRGGHAGASGDGDLTAFVPAALVLLLGALAALVLSPAGRSILWPPAWRALASLIAAVALLFAFEGGLHSVHHLGQDERLSRCSIELAWSQLGGSIPLAPDVGASVAPDTTVIPPRHAALAPPLRRGDRDRAPPLGA